jgi:hypothetical protein
MKPMNDEKLGHFKEVVVYLDRHDHRYNVEDQNGFLRERYHYFPDALKAAQGWAKMQQALVTVLR